MIIHHATKMCSDMMKDTTYGVNAMIDALPDLEDADQPTKDKYKVKAVYNDVEDAVLMTEDGPSKLPALLVMADTDPSLRAESYQSGQVAQELTVAFIYVTDEEQTEIAARYQGGLVARAVRRSLNRMNIPANRKAASLGDEGGIRFLQVISMSEQRVIGKIGSSALKGAVLAQIRFLDTLP